MTVPLILGLAASWASPENALMMTHQASMTTSKLSRSPFENTGVMTCTVSWHWSPNRKC